MTSLSSPLLSLALVQWTLFVLFARPETNDPDPRSVVGDLSNLLVLNMARKGIEAISGATYRRALKRARREDAFIFLDLPKPIRLRIYELLFGSGESNSIARGTRGLRAVLNCYPTSTNTSQSSCQSAPSTRTGTSPLVLPGRKSQLCNLPSYNLFPQPPPASSSRNLPYRQDRHANPAQRPVPHPDSPDLPRYLLRSHPAVLHAHPLRLLVLLAPKPLNLARRTPSQTLRHHNHHPDLPPRGRQHPRDRPPPPEPQQNHHRHPAPRLRTLPIPPRLPTRRFRPSRPQEPLVQDLRAASATDK